MAKNRKDRRITFDDIKATIKGDVEYEILTCLFSTLCPRMFSTVAKSLLQLGKSSKQGGGLLHLLLQRNHFYDFC